MFENKFNYVNMQLDEIFHDALIANMSMLVKSCAKTLHKNDHKNLSQLMELM